MAIQVVKEISEYRQNLKSLILAEAKKRFCEQGVKSARMDDIAKGLKISKRTIYEIYSNKEDLLIAIIKEGYAEHLKELDAFASNSSDVMDIMLEVFRLQMENIVQIHPNFIYDIHKYPKALDTLRELEQQRSAGAKSFFEKGVTEGYFLDTIDFVVFVNIMTSITETMRELVYKGVHTYKEILSNYIVVMVRGVCTQKGIQRMDTFLENQKL